MCKIFPLYWYDFPFGHHSTALLLLQKDINDRKSSIIHHVDNSAIISFHLSLSVQSVRY